MALSFPRRLSFPRNPGFMMLLCSLAACLFAVLMTRPVDSFQPNVPRPPVPPTPVRPSPQRQQRRLQSQHPAHSHGPQHQQYPPRKQPQRRRFRLFLSSDSSSEAPTPTTFREAEVLGLKLMQEGDYDLALKAFQTGLKLPGSRSDVVRTKSLSGPSPVGGAMGGTESKATQSLDEFELQAAHYNMACAYAQLGRPDDAIRSLETAFQAGFDNYATVRGDPDLEPVKKEKDFERLMEKYEPKRGFNPFGLFGGKK